MAEVFPSSPTPSAILFDLENVSRSGGISTNGQEQIVQSGVSRWTATVAGLFIRRNDQILAWRALAARMRGRSGTILVPVFDGKRANWPRDQYGRQLKPNFTRYRALDGTQYESPELPQASRIIASFSASAAHRATTVQISMSQGTPPQVGQYFSPSPGRLHIITEAIGGTAYRIEPPLRAPVTAGQAVNFERPTCEMRLKEDAGASLPLSLMQFSNLSLDFVEAF